MVTKTRTPLRWYPLREAAEILGVSADALRKRLERHSRRAEDGVIEAQVDGIRGRKFGNHWRVSFAKPWTE